MKTAFETSKKWGIVPTYKVDPENRERSREEFRKALQAMQEAYVEKTQTMRPPPTPGPRPKLFTGAPPFPEALPKPAEPQRPTSPRGLPRYPTDDQLFAHSRTPEGKKDVDEWHAAMDTYNQELARWRPEYDAVMAAERRLHEEYTKKNDEWVDTIFFPNEAERVIWEAAHAVEEEFERAVRAEADLARDQMDIRRAKREQLREAAESWSPILLRIGIAAGGLSAVAYVIWRIFS